MFVGVRLKYSEVAVVYRSRSAQLSPVQVGGSVEVSTYT
jgi:hypothetical protein